MVDGGAVLRMLFPEKGPVDVTQRLGNVARRTKGRRGFTRDGIGNGDRARKR